MKWSGQLLFCNYILVVILLGNILFIYRGCNAQYEASTWNGNWQIAPTTPVNTWSLNTRIPMSAPRSEADSEETDELGRGKGGFKVKKKYKKFLLPLLLAYKLKFFALIPVMIGMLLLLTGATGLAGFFFALFAATMGLNKSH